MSNEIATRDEQTAVATQQAPALPAPQPTAGTTALVAWAQEASLAYDMAQKLAATSFVPQSLRGKPGDIAAAILAGSELGLKPMATLKSIDIIQGTPALRAHAMRAVIQNQGHDIELVESADTHCRMRGRRKGADAWQEVFWDIPRARLLGLLNKDQWKKQPKAMLVARATGELCRLIASDALHGMAYVSEELDGYTHGEIAPQRAPLSVAAITAPAATPAAPEAAPAPQAEYSVDRADADETSDGVWDEDAVNGSTDWPETATPGGAA
ncbi:hypothetical protein PV728_47850 [Streptomyces europaeiscabiei]|uniref:hypothetical protein n=1 Tax=Streptomyces europaeiscabiei TaxID=146819 RepID=UPI0029B92DE7|nr:hypothetical protein [Streptomyces europaeiscabiei]MDX3637765.1 hypothetical protein [Streptomyces europaeiscabiei]MDX3655577.1 hypothetical protein [Streptomyces europaeiscabiei]